MAITLKHLKALSEEYNFGYDDARRFLGHKVPQKATGCSKSGTCVAAVKPIKVLAEVPKTRGKTGYQTFVSEASSLITGKLHQKHNGKIPRGAFQSEASRLWKALDEHSREQWNLKAATANARGRV